MAFDDLTTPSDYHFENDILERETEIISKNDEFWVETKKRYGEGYYS